MEDIPHHRLYILQPPGEQLLQVEVQLSPVLDHAVAQPCRQSRIPAVQPVMLNVLLQNAV